MQPLEKDVVGRVEVADGLEELYTAISKNFMVVPDLEAWILTKHLSKE